MKIGFCFAIVLWSAVTLSIGRVTRAQSATTERVSVDSSGAQGNNQSEISSISDDGRYVAFVSTANNLVIGDTNGTHDVFVRDRQIGTTVRVSVSTSGAQGNGQSYYPSISADGRFVAFPSAASNFVPGDTAGYDVFVRDRQIGTTERVSVDTGGAPGNANSYYASISADGRYVEFESEASNLVAGDTNGYADVFVRDRQSGTTERVSVDSAGVQGNDQSGFSGRSISADGRYVAFASGASNLVAGDTNGVRDIFVRDRQNGTTELVSVASGGAQGNSDSVFPSISADGHYVSFYSGASSLVMGDTNGAYDVFVRDRQIGTTERVSVSTSGAQGYDQSYFPSISAHGRYVAFASVASNLVAGDTNATHDVFVRDRLSGTTERVSVTTGGAQGDNISRYAEISADGRFVAFQSFASNLVAGDTNGFVDIFVRDRGPLPPTIFCTSSTSTNACNASIAVNSNPSVALAHACSITVASVEAQKSGILFYGINNTAFVPAPWAPGSTSFLCVKQPTQRSPIQNSGGTLNACNGSYVLDWNAYQTANPFSLGNPWSVGDKVYVQAWFRDLLAVKSTNLSNAVEMTYQP